MSSRNVVHVTNSFLSNATGITDFVRALAVAQSSDGHHVQVVCDNTDEVMRSRMEVAHVQLIELGKPHHLLGAARTLREALATAHIVHVHTVHATALAAVARPGFFWRRSVSTVHNPYGRFVRLQHTATMTVTLASSARRPFAARKTTFIPNPVIDPLFVDNDIEHAFPTNMVLYVGGLSERKGIDTLLQAWVTVQERVRTAHLYLVGNRDAPSFEAIADALNISSSVTFAGFTIDPRPFLKAATVFVLPSRREGYPLVLPQARSARVAIVATRVDGVPDALDFGAAGLLIEPGDPQALASAIVRLLEDQTLRDSLIKASDTTIGVLSLLRIAARYDGVYAQVCGQ